MSRTGPDSSRYISWDRILEPAPTLRPWGAQINNTKKGHHCVGPEGFVVGGLECCQFQTVSTNGSQQKEGRTVHPAKAPNCNVVCVGVCVHLTKT